MENDLSTSITEINNNLIVSLSGEMSDMNIYVISDMIAVRAYEKNIKGALLNFSMITVMDSYTFNEFRKISASLELMGVKVVWAGLRPGVVSALMDLNINFDTNKLCTAMNLEHGLAILNGNHK